MTTLKLKVSKWTDNPAAWKEKVYTEQTILKNAG